VKLETLFSGVRTLIFELDGTLLPMDRLRFEACRRALEQWHQSLEWATYRKLLARTRRETFERILARLDLKVRWTELAAAADRELDAALNRPRLPVLAPAPAFLRAIPRAKYATVLVSIRPIEQIESRLARSGLGRFFDNVISGSDLPRPPEPDLYNSAIEIAGVTPWSAVAFESTSAGVLAAVRASARVVAVPTDSTRLHDLSRAHVRVDKLDQLIPHL
jgi:beta-phosphoglucomutase-like phosphatase (HAD superfamily)